MNSTSKFLESQICCDPFDIHKKIIPESVPKIKRLFKEKHDFKIVPGQHICDSCQKQMLDSASSSYSSEYATTSFEEGRTNVAAKEADIHSLFVKEELNTVAPSVKEKNLDLFDYPEDPLLQEKDSDLKSFKVNSSFAPESLKKEEITIDYLSDEEVTSETNDLLAQHNQSDTQVSNKYSLAEDDTTPLLHKKEEIKIEVFFDKMFFVNVPSAPGDHFGAQVSKEHKVVHSDTKTLQCPHCDLVFERTNELKSHAVDHSDLKLFRRPLCNPSFKRKTDMRSHTDLKLFRCVHCDLAFKYKFELKSHSFVHSKKPVNEKKKTTFTDRLAINKTFQ